MMLVLLWRLLDFNTVQQWTFFFDSSELSLKSVLLHNGNEYPAVPSADAVYVRRHKTTCNFSLQVLAMKNTPGVFAGTYLDCSLDIGSTAVFVWMGRHGHKNRYIRDNDRWENNCIQERNLWRISHRLTNLLTSFTHQTRSDKKKNSSRRWMNVVRESCIWRIHFRG